MITTMRPDQAWRELVSDGRADLADIDAELDDGRLETLEFASPAANPEDDQATALRRMVDQAAEPLARREPRGRATGRRSAPRRLAPVIAIASGKGGVGKTNIAVNTAICLARRGLRVTLLDADLGTANADVLCGITPSARLDHVLAPAGLTHQDGGTRSITDIAVAAPGGFRLVPGSAGIGRMADLTAAERRWLVNGLFELAADADALLIDAAAGVGQGVTAFLQAADLAVVVTTPEPTAIADAYALIKCLVMDAPPGFCLGRPDEHRAEGRCHDIALVVNQAREPVEAFATHARISRVCDRFLGLTIPMLGFIAQDMRIPEAVRAQTPLVIAHPDSPASRSLSDLSGAIVNMLGLRPGDPTRPDSRASRMRRNRGLATLVRRLLGFSPTRDNAAEIR